MRDSEEDSKDDEQSLLAGYTTGGVGGVDRLSPSRLNLINPTRPHSPPLFAMDINSVRYWPSSVMTSSELTSTHHATRLEPLESNRINKRIILNKNNNNINTLQACEQSL